MNQLRSKMSLLNRYMFQQLSMLIDGPGTPFACRRYSGDYFGTAGLGPEINGRPTRPTAVHQHNIGPRRRWVRLSFIT